jgi:hypothetical protein
MMEAGKNLEALDCKNKKDLPLPRKSFQINACKALSLENACTKQNCNDKQCKKNKEQHLCDISRTFCDSTESEYSCYDRDHKKDN